jgi:hypothetical protein
MPKWAFHTTVIVGAMERERRLSLSMLEHIEQLRRSQSHRNKEFCGMEGDPCSG